MSVSTENCRAIWKPSWYEMDQSLTVGVHQKFWFFQDDPSQAELKADFDYVFYNQLDSDTNTQVRFAEIVEIHHSVLGPLSQVDTDGLDYIFVPMGAKEILVNAEEEPGKTYDSELEIADWTLHVTLQNVSDPISDIV